MRWLAQLRLRCVALFRKETLDREMAEEMAVHLELQVEANREAGMTAEDAHHAARRQFGGIEQIKEVARDGRGVRPIEELLSDLRYGARLLRHAPGFTITAVLTLALGIGACAAIFSVINTTLFHPLPYPEVNRIFVLHEVDRSTQTVRGMSPATFFEFRRALAGHAAIALAGYRPHNLIGGREPVRVFTQHATTNFFSVLGVAPELGRDFEPADAQGTGDRVVILSHRLWQSHFDGRPDIVGKVVQMDGHSVTIIGVMPANFLSGATAPPMFAPLPATGVALQNRTGRGLYAIGRLLPGASLEEANRILEITTERLARDFPDSNRGWTARGVPILEDSVGFARPLGWAAMGGAGLLLLIACVNNAHLLLARTTARRREIVVRRALGAGRWRIARQLICEGAVLSALGGIGGMILAYGGVRLITAILPVDLPRSTEISLDAPTLLLSCGLTALAAIAFGLTPAFYATREELATALKDNGTRAAANPEGLRVRHVLVVVQLALALVLLASAGVLSRSFLRMVNIDRGYPPENLYSTPITLSAPSYTTPQAVTDFVNQATARIERLPRVQSAAFAVGRFTTWGFTRFVIVDGPPPPETPVPLAAGVSAHYFATLGVPTLQGRVFTEADDVSAPWVLVINQSFSRIFFPGVDPIGHMVIVGVETTPRKIVGIVGDVRANDSFGPILPQLYVPLAQRPNGILTIAVRMQPGAAPDIPAIAANIHALDPLLPFTEMYAATNSTNAGAPAVRRFAMILAVTFSSLALLLSAVGVYGVMAFSVAQRMTEIGVRLALGATPQDVRRYVFRGGLRLVALGLTAGLLIAVATIHHLDPLLFETHPRDPMTLGTILLLLGSVSLLACWLPARAAVRMNPADILRHE